MIKVEAVDISNKSNFQNIPIYPIYFFDIAFDNIRLGPVPKFLEQKELE